MMMTTKAFVNTIIVGGGHCGCNFACWLEKHAADRSYLLLERSDALFSKWKYQRWEGFQLNTPIRFTQLHGEGQTDLLLDRPLSQDIQRWDDYAAKMNLKCQLNANVVKVTRNQQTGHFTTEVVLKSNNGSNDGDEQIVTYTSKNVICCNGVYDHPKISSNDILTQSHPNIKQHTPFGFSVKHLNPGGVLIVGGGQSGVQLADLILEEDKQQHRPVVLCASLVKGCPRTYRGYDLFYWLDKSGFIYTPKSALEKMPPEVAEGMRYGPLPIVGAIKNISYLSLQRKGAVILGRLDSIQTTTTDNGTNQCEIALRPNRAECVQMTMAGYNKILELCRATAEKLQEAGATFEEERPDPEWTVESEQDQQLLNENGPSTYNLDEHGITNVIWATGFAADFSWLQIPEAFEEFDQRTNLPDDLECQGAPGLFFTGFPWVGNLQSTNLVNFDHDQKIILEKLKD